MKIAVQKLSFLPLLNHFLKFLFLVEMFLCIHRDTYGHRGKSGSSGSSGLSGLSGYVNRTERCETVGQANLTLILLSCCQQPFEGPKRRKRTMQKKFSFSHEHTIIVCMLNWAPDTLLLSYHFCLCVKF